jgi:hypothetical protein
MEGEAGSADVHVAAARCQLRSLDFQQGEDLPDRMKDVAVKCCFFLLATGRCCRGPPPIARRVVTSTRFVSPKISRKTLSSPYGEPNHAASLLQ